MSDLSVDTLRRQPPHAVLPDDHGELTSCVLEHAGDWDRARRVSASAHSLFERLSTESDMPQLYAALGRGESLGAVLALATPALARDVARACGLLVERGAGLTSCAPWFGAQRVRCVRDASGYMLSGECGAVVEAQEREQLIVRVSDTAFARVPLRAAGVEVSALPGDAAACAALGRVRLSGVRLSPEAIGELSRQDIDRLRARHTLWIAHALSSFASATFLATLRFVGERGFRGGKLSDLSVVRHKLAEIGVHPEVFQAQLRAAGEEAAPQVLRSLLVSETLSEQLPTLVKGCQQLHGGRGFLTESRIARDYRDCLHLDWLLGSRSELRQSIGARRGELVELNALRASFGSHEHAAFRRRVVQLVEEHAAGAAQRCEQDPRAVAGLHALFARENVTTLRLGAEAGGGGKDFGYSLILAEELTSRASAGLGVSLMIAAGAVVPLLAREASPELRAELWPRLKCGQAVLSFGITEPSGGSDLLHSLETRARLDGEHWVLNGRKMFITNGPIADYILVLARTSDRPGPFHSSFIAVPVASAGVTVGTPYDTLGLRASPTGWVDFREVRVPKHCLIGRAGLGMHYLADSISEERTLIAVGGLTLARTLVQDALSRAGDGPSGPRLLSWLARLDALFCLAADTGQAIVRGGRDHAAAGLLKFAACEATQEAIECAAEAIAERSHLSEEASYTRALRDARVLTVFAGTTETLRELVGASIAARARLGNRRVHHA